MMEMAKLLSEASKETGKSNFSFEEISKKFSPKELLANSESIGIAGDSKEVIEIIQEEVSQNYEDILDKYNKGEATREELNDAYTKKVEALKDTYIKSQEAEVQGVEISEYGFPEFEPIYETDIQPEDFDGTRGVHFQLCNQRLKEAIENNPALAEKFTDRQLEQIKMGKTPEGYTWHHDGNPPPGKMQLVDTKVHDAVRHHGGYSQW